ncbi:tetraacyldisaccharide 4'-kinase [Candidatus Fermentibacteria bacterium]|nr:MAG: tetraacyldisaccharide 4'-kinase [Candidatus Fermentibacteria bacterium]
MRLADVHEKIIRREGPWLWAAWLLQPAAFLYMAGAMLNRFRFRRGFFSRRSFPGTVIVSVGNIEVGGVGKTPVTIRIARKLSDMGLKVAVVAKNLGAGKHVPVAVRPGKSSGAVTLSDEPVLLGRALRDYCTVYAGPDKTEAVQRAVREQKPHVVVVDDGFQHHKLHRDIDVVVLNAEHPFGMGGLLPAGTLREHTGVLKKADYLWINGVTSKPQLSLARRLIASRNWQAPFIASSIVPGKPVRHDGSSDRPGRVVAFCGIGKPHGFRSILERTGFTIDQFRVFPDHWRYRESDIRMLGSALRKSGAEYLITTEKDAARLGPAMVKKLDIRVLPIGLSVDETGTEEELLGNILELTEGI